jgi:hypothetical protein
MYIYLHTHTHIYTHIYICIYTHIYIHAINVYIRKVKTMLKSQRYKLCNSYAWWHTFMKISHVHTHTYTHIYLPCMPPCGQTVQYICSSACNTHIHKHAHALRHTHTYTHEPVLYVCCSGTMQHGSSACARLIESRTRNSGPNIPKSASIHGREIPGDFVLGMYTCPCHVTHVCVHAKLVLSVRGLVHV